MHARSPLDPSIPYSPIDSVTFLQVLHSQLGEWFGTVGGVNPNQLDVVSLGPASTITVDKLSREIVVRFPRT